MDKIIHGIAFIQDPLAGLGLPYWISYGVYIGEIIAPLFLILGLGARIAALVIAINMVMAVILDAHKLAFTINGGGGWGLELEALYFITAVTITLIGPGRFRLFANVKPAGAPQSSSPQ